MLIRAIRNFREKTRERYEAAQEENMEPWKKRVRALHEEAAFLFYFEEVEPEPDSLLRFLIRGELVKGDRSGRRTCPGGSLKRHGRKRRKAVGTGPRKAQPVCHQDHRDRRRKSGDHGSEQISETGRIPVGEAISHNRPSAGRRAGETDAILRRRQFVCFFIRAERISFISTLPL